MSLLIFLEQCLNGLQSGLMLFLIAAGLTLVFGIMNMINLAHGALYMVGAYVAASIAAATQSFIVAVLGAMTATFLLGVLLEILVMRRLYSRDHLSQVLATFALILMTNEVVRMIWGQQPISLNPPAMLAGPVNIAGTFSYSAYRLAIIGVGVIVAVLLYIVVTKTRVGMLIRAGASNRMMATVMGVNIGSLFTIVFGAGAAISALAGAMLGPVLAVQIGMGESILILAFVVIVIGGIGSIRGALVGSLLVGFVDTLGRTFVPMFLREVISPASASAFGATIASILIYLMMAVVLTVKPQGLFPAHG